MPPGNERHYVRRSILVLLHRNVLYTLGPQRTCIVFFSTCNSKSVLFKILQLCQINIQTVGFRSQIILALHSDIMTWAFSLTGLFECCPAIFYSVSIIYLFRSLQQVTYPLKMVDRKSNIVIIKLIFG